MVDGFTITMGNADKSDNLGLPQNSGAGWFNDGSLASHRSNPQFRNYIFINNHAVGFGGAIYHDCAFAGQIMSVIINCSFIDNNTEEGGGAIYHNASFSGLSRPTYRWYRFLKNGSANSGRAFYTNAIQGTGLANVEGCFL